MADMTVGRVSAATGGQAYNPAVAVISLNSPNGASGTGSNHQYNGMILLALVGRLNRPGSRSTICMCPSETRSEIFQPILRFNNNKRARFSSCDRFGVPVDSTSEIDDLYNATQSTASVTKLDPRFILAVVMQESGGCVRTPTTNYRVHNPGSIQDHNGAGTCNDARVVKKPMRYISNQSDGLRRLARLP